VFPDSNDYTLRGSRPVFSGFRFLFDGRSYYFHKSFKNKENDELLSGHRENNNGFPPHFPGIQIASQAVYNGLFAIP